VVAKTTIVSSKPSSSDDPADVNYPVSMNLYPNPASNTLNIITTGLRPDKPLTLSLVSATGVILKSVQVNISNQRQQMDVSSLKAGVYIIRVLNGGKVAYKQFVKL
jgi:hypothetical protein